MSTGKPTTKLENMLVEEQVLFSLDAALEGVLFTSGLLGAILSIEEPPIKDPLRKGQPLYKGHLF